jgi:hypothetical protein
MPVQVNERPPKPRGNPRKAFGLYQSLPFPGRDVENASMAASEFGCTVAEWQDLARCCPSRQTRFRPLNVVLLGLAMQETVWPACE